VKIDLTKVFNSLSVNLSNIFSKITSEQSLLHRQQFRVNFYYVCAETAIRPLPV